ncbi:MAG: sigma 54-interacting transcriptional regulator [Thermodesulfobacteriota bacterium]
MNSSKRILVVDDEPYNLALLEAMLESLGHAAELATDGIQALERLGPDIDLVLLDVMMPGIDGFEVARRIRGHPACGHIPIIMVTALNSREDRLKAVEAGANDFISKPIDQVELRVRMASLLKFKEAQDMVLRHQAELESTVEKRTRALRESEERFRAVFETAQDGIFVKDRYLRYTHVNPAMLRFVGKPAEEVVGKTDEDIFGPQLAHTIRDVERRVLGGQTIETEHTWRSNQGPVTLACVRVPLMAQNGSVTGICGIARDVTEFKELFDDPAPKPDEFPSAAMRHTLERVRLAAETDSLILFLGESGVGKDYMARYLHDHSRRASGPFFSINCAALAPELAESELFGHEAGAFTGSRGRKRGLLELAEGGTLLLNEIGELSPRLQAKLLTFLDSQSFTRVGGEKSITVNARLVAATNRDLEEEVERGGFRKDLYYRLNVFSITVPPLRERTEDLPLLVRDLLTNLVTKMGAPKTVSVTPEAMRVLRDYPWPGNVRELRNALERALILAGGSSINSSHLGMHSGTLERVDPQEEDAFVIRMSAIESMTEVLEEAKRWLVSKGLVISGGSVKEAASRLGITRDQMKYLMKSLGVRR